MFGGLTTKGRRFPVEVLTAEEVRRLMGACSRRGSCGVRDRALIAVMYRGGLRIAEALALMPKDVDVSTGTVSVLHAKGGKTRTVGVDAETVALCEVWMAKRAALGLGGRHPLFCTLGGGTMYQHQVRENLKALAEKVGIEKRVHPHGLRHSFASELAGERVDLRVIQGALGHANASTTDRYIRHLAPEAVIETMKARVW